MSYAKINIPAHRPCRGTRCGKWTLHKSGLCAECRYDEEMGRTEVLYEVAITKTVHPSLESMAAPVDGYMNYGDDRVTGRCDGE